MFLLRKQRYQENKLFNLNVKSLAEKINSFAAEDRFSFFYLVSILASMSTLSMNTFNITNLLLKRFVDQNHPEYNKNAISVQNAIEIFNGFGQKGYFLSASERKLIVEIVKNLAKNLEKEENISILVTLVRSLSKLNVNDVEMLPFLTLIGDRIREEVPLNSKDILSVLDIGNNTNYHSITKIPQDIKKRFLDVMVEGGEPQNMDALFKVLQRISGWSRNYHLTKEQEAAVIDYMEREF